MKRYFVIERRPGTGWEAGVPMREQPGWDEHAAFMDGLAASGRIVLGGPVGDEGEILLVAAVESEPEARAMLDADPWAPSGILSVHRVRPWTVLLEGGLPGRIRSSRRGSRPARD